MPETKSRDYYFDNLKFVLIALVVIGHVLEPLYGTSPSAKALYQFIYFFHIPLFVFITGYFSKKFDKISPLVVMYLIFEVLYTLFDYALYDRPDLQFQFSFPYWMTWYLLAVIVWKIVLPYFIRLKHPIVIAGILAVLAGYAAKDFGYHFSSLRAFTFFPFFLAGYYCQRQYLSFLFKSPVKVLSVIVLVSAPYLLYQYGQDIKCEWLWGSYSYKNIGSAVWYAGIYRVAVSAVAVLLCAGVLSLVPQKKTWVSELGSRTMYPFLLHGFIVKYAIYLGIYRYVSTGLDQALLIAAAVAVTLLLSSKWVAAMTYPLFHPRISFLYRQRNDVLVTSAGQQSRYGP